MKYGLNTLTGIAGVAAFAGAMIVGAANNPYQAIVERNIFSLKPIPPVVPPEPPKPPAPTFVLNGITTLFGSKRVLLTATIPTRPGDKPTPPLSLMLSEGERSGDIEIKEIDEKENIVKVEYQGAAMDPLTFAKNGAKLQNPPPQFGGVPGAPPINPGLTLNPAGGPSAGSAVATFGDNGIKSLPTRTLRTSPGGVPGGAPGSLPVGGFGAPIPQRAAPAPQSNLSPEETTILMEVERQRLHNTGDPLARLMPPTELTPPGAGPTILPKAPAQGQPSLPPLPR
jgi:hypothetical protein